MNITFRVVFTLALVFSISACASQPELKKGATTAFTTVKDGVGRGVGGVKSMFKGKGGGSRKNNRQKAADIAARYPKTEAPHTIMVKPVAQGRLTSGFGFRLNPAGIPIPKGHKGVDYVAPKGTAIYAADDGVVVRKYVSKSYGKYIKIQHENGFSTAYAHMSEFVNGVEDGGSVKRGQKIGEVGSTGRSTGNHLHFELMHNGKAIDPFFARPLN